MVDLIQQDNYVKILDNDANNRQDKGVALVQTLVLAGCQYNGNILGAYAIVKAQYDLTGTAIPVDGIVLGDTTGYRYKLRDVGDPAVDPDNDTNVDPVTGVGDNWINIEIASANTFVIEKTITLNRHYFTSAGTDDYILTTVSPDVNDPIEEYRDGDDIWFKVANPNTGASTVDIDGAGVKNLTLVGGSVLPAGALIPGLGNWYNAKFDELNDRFELLNPEAVVVPDSYDEGYLFRASMIAVDDDAGTVPPAGIYTAYYKFNDGKMRGDLNAANLDTPGAGVIKRFDQNWSKDDGSGDTGGFPTGLVRKTNHDYGHWQLVDEDGVNYYGWDEEENWENPVALIADVESIEGVTIVDYRRRGWVRSNNTNGLTLLVIYQVGDYFQPINPVLSNQTMFTASNVITTAAPRWTTAELTIAPRVVNNGGSDETYGIIRNLQKSAIDLAPTAGTANVFAQVANFANPGFFYPPNHLSIQVNANRQVGQRFTQGGTLRVVTKGWYDNRGQYGKIAFEG